MRLRIEDIERIPEERRTFSQKQQLKAHYRAQDRHAASLLEAEEVKAKVLGALDEHELLMTNELIKLCCPHRSHIYMAAILNKLREAQMIAYRRERYKGKEGQLVYYRTHPNPLFDLIPPIPKAWETLPVSMFGSADDYFTYGGKDTSNGSYQSPYGNDALWPESGAML